MKSLPASSFREDSGKGTMSRQCTTCSTWHRVCSGFQSFFRVLTQISPAGDTLGWKILVRKRPAQKVGEEGEEKGRRERVRVGERGVAEWQQCSADWMQWPGRACALRSLVPSPLPALAQQLGLPSLSHLPLSHPWEALLGTRC